MTALQHMRRSDDESTIAYYETQAASYADSTRSIDMTELYQQFLPHVARGGQILDAGSGSGRDTLAFLNRGYMVEAFDASPRLADLSTRLTGIKTKVLRLQAFRSSPRFDGIWACASLLHVPLKELPDALRRLADALKPGGALFISVKKGSGERIALDGRLFTDLNEVAACRLLKPLDLEISKIWISEGEGARRGLNDWLNVLAIKKPEQRSQ